MSASRLVGPRALRLNLSTRYQCLQRRFESTARLAPNPTPTATVSQHPTPNPAFLKRNRGAVVLGIVALAIGAVGGQFVVHTLSPPPLPDAGSREDGILLADLNQRIDEHFKVKVLRGKCLGVAKQLKGQEGGWLEVVQSAAQVDEDKSADGSLVTQMQGAKGLGVERVFWDRGEQRLVAVVWFGGSLCGWPGVTHGGAIATALAEKLSLASALAQDSEGDVSAAAVPQRLLGTGNHAKMLAPTLTPDEPAQLSLGYLKPTYANQFYVIRVMAAQPEHKDAELTPEPYGGAEYEATLETQDGKVCVKARGRFKPSTAAQRMEEKVAGGAKQSYEQFKEWMWPSRQKTSQVG
ncbi:uncharacterized protein LTR77_000408 [Saxophila tyrrhenica]|uniref:Thioesterase domain-containing protein n=1 Tax=Saxophila tyrrhenica TaxID=1690608 RepID=A0AAV9PMR8_9PEZI|nr:hypothetical protein LTR77_000408 [Saxophila tyrrhenica]